MKISEVSVLALAITGLSPAIAQDTQPSPGQVTPDQAAPEQTPVEQTTPEEAAPEENYDEEIIVIGRPERGAVVGDIPPEVTLDARDIRAYGASNLADLLDQLSPQTQSGRGRGSGQPVILLNGRRISGFSEIRSLPPEALERVDILPEEVALKYGYRADQRVVNFVLRERFRAITAEVEGGLPTAGGRSDFKTQANALRIREDTRLSLDASYQKQSMLLESERDVIDADPNRSLLPSTDQLSVGATYSRNLFGNIATTLNARLDRNSSDSLLGLPEAALIVPADNPYSSSPDDTPILLTGTDVLGRDSSTWTGHLGLTMNGSGSPWNWSITGNYDHAESESSTDRGFGVAALQDRLNAGDPTLNPFAANPDLGPLIVDQARSKSDTADLEFVTNGSLFHLPAGDVSATVKAGVETRQLSSEGLRSGIFQDSDLSRSQANLQANVDLPIASRREDVLAGIGNLSANFNVAVDKLSDFGTLTTWGAGLNWSPVEQVRVIASYTKEDGAPTIQQLGDPQVLTPNVRVFDFTTGETVDVTRLDGGNRGLLADNRRVFKLGLNVKPLKDADLTVSADFIDSRTRNPIASFPTATPEIEAAFPERFVRDASGRLVLIDSRPVNFARADRQELRWGINFSEPLEPSASERAQAEARRAEFRARREAAEAAGTAPPEGGPGQGAGEGRGPRGPGGPGGFGGRGFGGRGGGGPEGRLQFSLYHTWRFKDEVEIRKGVPVLDLLNGSATGNQGGQSQHLIEARAGVAKNGLGARLNVNWQSGTRVLADPASPVGSSEDLFFSDFTTVGLRFFADLGQQRSLVREWGFLRGARVSLSVDNLFDSRLDVRTRSGTTPVSYQPDLLDPLGRTVRLSFRKLFF